MTQEDYARWFNRGREHQQAGHLVEAMLCYRRALNANARSLRAHFRLGQVLRDLGNAQEARALWQAGLAIQPEHVPTLLELAAEARHAGALDQALGAYDRVLTASPGLFDAVLGISLIEIERGEARGYARAAQLVAADRDPGFWSDLAQSLAAAPPSPARTALVAKIASLRLETPPPLLLACVAEEMIALGRIEDARDVLARTENARPLPDDPETLRRLALAGARLGSFRVWAERYASRCVALSSAAPPLRWPRRTAGTALRVAYVVAAGTRLTIDGVAIDTDDYLRAVVAPQAGGRILAAVFNVGEVPRAAIEALLPPDIAVAALATGLEAAASALANVDADALVDLAGLGAPIGPLLAQRPARTLWTYAGLGWANAAPLVTGALPPLPGADAQALDEHRAALERVLLDACTTAAWFTDVAPRTATELDAVWRGAVAAHQSGSLEAARAGYEDLLADEPRHARASYLLGLLLRNEGQSADAVAALSAAVEAAPAYLDARIALADVYRERQRLARSLEVCEEGLRATPDEVLLWRALGLTQLARRDARAARRAFRKALALAPGHAMTHYNEGVALQMLRRNDAALRSYQRALALAPDLRAAQFNIGIILREAGRAGRAIKAFERVLARDPAQIPAHKALLDTLQDQGNLAAWFAAFDRFEAACPNAFPLLVVALQVCQYRADFAALDRYLARLKRDEFKASSETELADCLEELLFLLLYFDFEPDAQFGLYQAYDAVARRVYGDPLSLPNRRRPGRIRIGYLSGDLRNHVMGKMMWSAIEHHDRERFELRFYSLSSKSDEWTERYRALGEGFEVITDLSEQEAAARIAADELDILVDLSTHTHGSKPGILALKPARVQLTHVASAGPVGLSTVDFKLTDACADLPEAQAFQLETFLPMAGCVYPYRHIPPAADHPFTRERLNIAPAAVVIGAFVNPLKLSRRCLALWREVLDRIPESLLALSPTDANRREIYDRLFRAAGIETSRVRVVPQGRDDGENQARYGVVDFALDPLPYGGVNGTLEALDMHVPVVALVGRRHGERSSYTILTHLGATQTLATSGSEYVEIAVRLASDAAFKAEVKAAIARGLERSPLTDMKAHTRNLEAAYLRALEQRYPEALAAPREEGVSKEESA